MIDVTDMLHGEIAGDYTIQITNARQQTDTICCGQSILCVVSSDKPEQGRREFSLFMGIEDSLLLEHVEYIVEWMEKHGHFDFREQLIGKLQENDLLSDGHTFVR